MTHNPFYWHGLHSAKQELFDGNTKKIWCAFIDQHAIRLYTLVLADVNSLCDWHPPSSLWMVWRHRPQNTNSVEYTQGALHYFLILPRSCYGPKLLSCVHWLRQAITLHCYYSCCIATFNCEAKQALIRFLIVFFFSSNSNLDLLLLCRAERTSRVGEEFCPLFSMSL